MESQQSFKIISQGINILIFIYFAVTLIKLHVLDIVGLSISAFGILISLLADIISTVKGK